MNLPQTSLLTILLLLAGCIDPQKDLRARTDLTVGTIGLDWTSGIDDKRRPDGLLDVNHEVGDNEGEADIAHELDLDLNFNDMTDETSDIAQLDTDALDLGEEVSDLDADNTCLPSCDGLACGPDGCGGSCGLCPTSKPQCILGQCKACQPFCSGMECGPNGCGGSCGSCPQGFQCSQGGLCLPPLCDSSVVVVEEEFDNCDTGIFEVLDFQPEDSVSWFPVATITHSGTCSVYLGDPFLLHYDTGARVSVTLRSKAIALPSQPTSMQFRIRAQGEAVPAPQYPYDYDVLFLYVIDEETGQQDMIFSTKSLLNNTNEQFVPVALDLLSYAGKTIRLNFVFDTLDSIDNEYAGFYLDSLKIATTCPYCTKAQHCDELVAENSCLVAQCLPFTNIPEAGICILEPDPECPPQEPPLE